MFVIISIIKGFGARVGFWWAAAGPRWETVFGRRRRRKLGCLNENCRRRKASWNHDDDDDETPRTWVWQGESERKEVVRAGSRARVSRPQWGFEKNGSFQAVLLWLAQRRLQRDVAVELPCKGVHPRR